MRPSVFQPDLAVVLAVDRRLNVADLFGHRCVGVELHLPFLGLGVGGGGQGQAQHQGEGGHALHRYLQVLP